MKCWRLDLQRKMAFYIQGQLSADSRRSLEDHLTECEFCQDRLNRVLQADKLAAELKPVPLGRDLWPKIEASLHAPVHRAHPRVSFKTAAMGTAGMALAIVFVLSLHYGLAEWVKTEGHASFDPSSFHMIPLDDFDVNAEPHVATEGYVSDISLDKEEGNYRFKLVDDLHRPNHFVVCEIINPLTMQIPSEGSRIRVYGVSRYDGKAHHQWYEVHPVLNIEPVRQEKR